MSPKVPNAQSPPRKSEIPSGSFTPRQNERPLVRSLRCYSILIGGLVGSGIAAAGLEVVKWNGIVNKVLVPMVVAPLVGLTLAFLLAVGIMRAFRRRSPGRVNRGFTKVQLGSSFFASLMHGANDGQKFVGVMTALLVGPAGSPGARPGSSPPS